jgi:DNA mismatch endonuclease (patch repair protein)
MTDIISKNARSKNMSAIKSKNTKPEIMFRKGLFSRGFRYRTNVSNIYGHPDIYLSKYHTAIFIHGCFWHRHNNCKYAYTPKSRIDFWENKFNCNIKRDLQVKNRLSDDGIKCLIIWECTIKSMNNNDYMKSNIYKQTEEFLKSDFPYLEI